jgi:hypothetical protein
MLTPRTGLKSPLETRKLRTSGAGDRLGRRIQPIPPAADSIEPQKGPSCFEFVAWLRFLATQERKAHLNQRAEGTKKMIAE